MKTAREMSKDIRDDYFRRFGSWACDYGDDDTLDTLIVGAVSPLEDRIKALQDGIRGILGPLTVSDVDHSYIARLRAILEDSER